MLDTRFLDSPAFALQQCKVAAAKMAELTETGLVTSVDLMASYNEADAENVDILEKKVDHFEDALGTYLVKLSSEKLSPKDSQTLSMILHCIGDFERISDHTVNIMKAAKRCMTRTCSSPLTEPQSLLFMEKQSKILSA